MPLRKKSLHLEERLRRSGGSSTLQLHPGRMDSEGRPCSPLKQAETCTIFFFASCLDVLECPTVNGLTWLLTCASLSQPEVRGHSNWGLAEGRADGGKSVEL